MKMLQRISQRKGPILQAKPKRARVTTQLNPKLIALTSYLMLKSPPAMSGQPSRS